MIDVTKADIVAMAEAIAAESLVFHEPACGEPHYYCIFCDEELHGWIAEKEDFLHKEGCPAAIADSVLRRLQP